MGRYRCAVRGCEGEDSRRYQFPQCEKFPDTFQQWVLACSNPELSGLDSKEIWTKKRICGKHFPQSSIMNIKLFRGVIPSLCLPNPDEERQVDRRPTPTQTGIVEQIMENVQEGPMPSTPTFDETYESIDPTGSDISSAMSENEEKRLAEKSFRRKREEVLHELGVTKSVQLTPKAKTLYRRTRVLNDRVRKLKQKSTNLRKQLKLLDNSERLETLLSPLHLHVTNFIKSQLNCSSRDPRGRRFTLDDKIVGLVMHKQSGRGYKYLRTLFALPSKKTITTLLNRIPITPGISEPLFRNLKNNVQLLSAQEKFCVLIFDEVSLEPHLQVNVPDNSIDGFVDFGDHESVKIADHALTFLVKGIKTEWKYPILYTFCRGTTGTIDLVRMIKDVIRRCHKCGLRVIATICDQGSTNRAAINYLMEHSVQNHREYSSERFFVVDNVKVFHIYDPPHLLKGIRNSLLKRNLVWKSDEGTFIARWADVELAYEIDNVSTELRAMPKLTEGHVNKRKIRKMKVSCASQVFSHTVASVIKIFAMHGVSGVNGHKMPKSATGTAKILKFFDKTFDSVNGSSLFSKIGKRLRTCATEDSEHLEFWQQTKLDLRNMYFQTEGTDETFVPPSLRNWIVTLNGLQNVYHALTKEGFQFLKPRAFNQDSIENMFGQLRQLGVRNVNPTATLFKAHFKTYLINNLVSKHSPMANCEDDSSILLSVRHFVTQGVPESEEKVVEDFANITIPLTIPNIVTKYVLGYVSGFIVRKLKTISCTNCKTNVLSTSVNEWHTLCLEREYFHDAPRQLKYCSADFIKQLLDAYSIILFFLEKYGYKKYILRLILKYLENHVNFKFSMSCEHNLKRDVLQSFVKLVSFNWCNGINKILSGKDERNVSGIIAAQARQYRIKRCK